jgi:hypothetical protein
MDQQQQNSVQAYQRMFPFVKLSIYQMELIEDTAQDAVAWRKTLEYWAGNDYRPQSVFKMLDYYRQVLTGVDRFGKRIKPDMTVGQSTYTPPDYKCGECLDTGEITVDDPDAKFSGSVKFVPCGVCGPVLMAEEGRGQWAQ